jgi:GNAT superfamily N-acetyltransferase
VADPPRRPVVEPLGPQHDRAAFSCGVPALDDYLRNQASQDARRFIAAPFVLVMQDRGVGGYYTLSATAIQLSELPPETVRRLPRYPLVPAFLLGRLAVDQRYRGQGWGRFLLADALHRCLTSEIVGFAVVVDAKDDSPRRFYERESFLALPDRPNRLFRRLSDIEALFKVSVFP